MLNYGISKPMNYVFRKKGDILEFVGDFESLYKNEEDPWNQSGTSGKIKHYYKHSRERLVQQLNLIDPESLIEIGCGLGYTTEIIQNCLPNCNILGMDISNTAINKAQKMFYNLQFAKGDIRNLNSNLDKNFDIVILNQLLWYILESLDSAINNSLSLLNHGGKIIISQAFLKTPQKYGKNICNGFEGLIRYLNDNEFDIEYSNLDDSNSFIHNDGIIVIKKR
jgi:SAM-dependent methyltransferase